MVIVHFSKNENIPIFHAFWRFFLNKNVYQFIFSNNCVYLNSVARNMWCLCTEIINFRRKKKFCSQPFSWLRGGKLNNFNLKDQIGNDDHKKINSYLEVLQETWFTHSNGTVIWTVIVHIYFRGSKLQVSLKMTNEKFSQILRDVLMAFLEINIGKHFRQFITYLYPVYHKL